MNSSSFTYRAEDGKEYSLSIRKRNDARAKGYYARFRLPSGERVERKLYNVNSFNEAKNLLSKDFNNIKSRNSFRSIPDEIKSFEVMLGNRPCRAAISKYKNGAYRGRIKVKDKRIEKSLHPSSNLKDAQYYFNKWISSLSKKSVLEEIMNCSASTISEKQLDRLIDRKGKNYKSKVFSMIQDAFENILELNKYREKQILLLKSKNISMKDISLELELTVRSVKSLMKKMKLKGIDIPNDHLEGYLNDECSNFAYIIDKYLDDGLSLGEIANITGRSPEFIRNNIYMWLIKK